jgi:glycosyltransferase involved in cell wall biosynthesis
MKNDSVIKKKIVFVTNSLVVKGGVECRTLEQMLYFHEKGFQTELCVLRQTGPLVGWFESHGIKVTHFPLYKSQLISTHPWIFIKFYLYILFNRFETIVCVQPISHYLARIACFPPMGRRIIAMERTNIEERSKSKLLLDYFCSLWTSKIICVSQHIADVFLKKTRINPHKFIVIPSPAKIAPSSGRDLPIRNEIKGKFVFGNISHFYPLKCHRVLIESFSQLSNCCPEAILILVGNGPEEPKMKKLCAELNIMDKVFFMGEQRFPHDYYPLFDVFVFPTVSEGTGNVFYEAMHHKVSVICSNIRPFSDYVVHGQDGLLFTPGSSGDLTEKMRLLYENASLRNKIRFNGYDLAQKHFDYNILMKKLFHEITGD